MQTTIVTMFFNLKTLKDASLETRPIDFYIKNSVEVLKLQYPMIIFCDETTYSFLKELREQHSNNSPTQYISKNITEYDYFKYNWDIVNNNRINSNGYKNAKDRNTVSYYLLNMFKPLALFIAKQRNDFDSKHYAWIDIGCNHVVRNIATYAPKMLDNPNPKVSACYIHYRSHEEIYPMKKYMEYGGKCGIAGGVYTVEKEYVDKYYISMFSIFYEMLYNQVGHSDETVMTYCFDKYPELFHIYYGDYYSLFTNYHEPKEDYNSIKYYFINESINKDRRDLAKIVAEKVLLCHQNKTIALDNDNLTFLQNI